ncbi:MAG: ribonuclease R, partial [Rhodospirillales bacterium]|nr:ribonuclease R [Rhodospirillales bacterium]
MAGKPVPFPTRDEVLRFVRESTGKTGMREIARAFNIRGNDRAALKDLVRSLEEEGALDGRSKRRRPAGTLPSVTVLEVDGLDSDGALSARPTRWEEPDPPPPITLDPAPRGVPEPGEGDRVLARLRPAPGGSYLARPMRVLDAGPRRVIGVFRATGSGGGVIEPAERRARRDL